MARLEYDEVKKRIETVDCELLDDFIEMGKSLVSDALDRISKSDNKALALAGYSGALLTLTMSTFSVWETYTTRSSKAFLAFGLTALVAAAWLATTCVFPQGTEWHSDEDWLITSLDRIGVKRYRVLTMWRIKDSIEAALSRKGGKLSWATRLLEFGVALLLIAFLQIAFRVATLHSLSLGIGNSTISLIF